jgi:hypothetical protein
MFDLKYYEMLSRTEKYFDEDKGNAMTRQYLHNFFSIKKGKKPDLWTKRINELPENDPLKDKIKELYARYGERGITFFQKVLQEVSH